MIKKWQIKSSPAPKFPDRKLLFFSSEDRGDAEKLKKSFTGYVGVVFKSDSADFQWAAYVYGASANIEKLINQELKELSLEPAAEPKKIEFPKKAQKPEEKISADADAAAAKKPVEPAKTTKEEKSAVSEKEVSAAAPVIEKKAVPTEKPAETKDSVSAPVIEQFGKKEAPVSPEKEKKLSVPVIEKFEQLTPDQSAEKPLGSPLIETFAGSEKPAVQKEEAPPAPSAPEKEPEAEKTDAKPGRKDARPIDVLYLCPESSRDKADIVKENIAKIVAEKNINFDFKPAGVVVYSEGASKESIMEEIKKYKFSFVLVVAPDAMGEELLREIKKKGFVPKVITEDNIDKKFRYLNLITDIVLSPRR